MFFKLEYACESPGDLANNADSDSGGLGWGARYSMSNQPSGDVGTVCTLNSKTKEDSWVGGSGAQQRDLG